jgi:NADH-quinone oxidoreductase subunit L
MHNHAVTWLGLIPLLPLLGAVLNGILALSRAHAKEGPSKSLVGTIACLATAGSFAVALVGFVTLLGLPAGERSLTQTVFTWISVAPLTVDFGFLLDPLSSAMLLFVTGIGFLIHLYSVGYMAHDRGFARYFAYLNLFMFAMILLVLGDSLPVLFIGWEGVGLCSYLLIGFWHEDPQKARAGMKAFVVNRIGDLGFLLGMFVIVWTLAPSVGAEGGRLLSYAFMRDHAELLAPAATLACLLLFVGATGKSAQIPLFTWLPDAMAGPTPVSALIHAATMVTSGVYMVGRMGFLYERSPVALTVVAVVGVLTAALAATIGLTQFDIKKVLAYSTVSQLGYMFLGVGTGAFAAGLFHVVTHAFFKALLFLGSGSVIHALSGEQDIRKMGGLYRKIPTTARTFLFGWLAICGIVPFAGFFSKDEILWKAFSTPNPVVPWLPTVLWVLAFLAAGLTAAYMTRLVVLTFFGKSQMSPEVEHHVHESPRTMTIPLVVLAVGSLLVGFLGTPAFLGLGPNRFERWLEPVFASAEPTGTGGGEALPMASPVGHNPAASRAAPGGDMTHGEATVAAHTPAAPGEAAGTRHGAVGAHALHDPALEWGLMLASLALAAVSALVAWRVYTRRPEVPEKIARSFGGLYRLARDKYRVDEAYDAAVVRPLVGGSRRVLFGIVDQRIIDALVNLTGIVTRFTGHLVALVQTGQVQTYALVLLLGVAVLWLTAR